MSPDISSYTLAEVVRSLKRIEQSQQALHDRFDRLTGDFVTRPEWNTKNLAYDREMKEVKADIKSRRAPWWSVVAVIAAAGSLLVTLIQSIPGA